MLQLTHGGGGGGRIRVGGGRIHPAFPCVSCKATKRVSRWQPVYKRGTTLAFCVTSTGMPAQIAANIPKPLMPNPHSTTYTHGATCF